MVLTSSYIFDNLSRMKQDPCSLDQDTIQNVSACNYTLQNYFLDDCSMQKPIDLATRQPCVFYQGGYNVGAGGCNVDINSKLTIGSIDTHPRCKIDLFQRPFTTVPYLGRGNVCPVLEAQLQQGEMGTNKRTVTGLTEKSYGDYHYTPLLHDIKDRVTNPAYCCEESANSGWVRSGIDTRSLTRDRETH